MLLAGGGSVPIQAALQYRTFREISAAQDELEVAISKDDPTDMMRFGAHRSPDGARRVRAYNGYTSPCITVPGKVYLLRLKIFKTWGVR